MVSEITVWVNEWIINPNGLRVTPYKDYGERSVIFAHQYAKRPAPALNEAQVRELVDWLNEWLAEGE